MGAYSEYLDRQMDFRALTAERKAQFERIARLRGGRDVLVYAADLTKVGAPISMAYAERPNMRSRWYSSHSEVQGRGPC